jgi:hypothetical protein
MVTKVCVAQFVCKEQIALLGKDIHSPWPTSFSAHCKSTMLMTELHSTYYSRSLCLTVKPDYRIEAAKSEQSDRICWAEVGRMKWTILWTAGAVIVKEASRLSQFEEQEI